MLVYGRQEFSVSNMGVKTQVQALSESLAGKKHATRYILPLACSLASQQSLVVMLKNSVARISSSEIDPEGKGVFSAT